MHWPIWLPHLSCKWDDDLWRQHEWLWWSLSFNAVKWVGGRCAHASVCLRESRCQLALCYFSSSPHLAEKLCVRVRARVSMHTLVSGPCVLWINSVNPFKHSCTRFILSLRGHRDHPTVVHCSRGSSPFLPSHTNSVSPTKQTFIMHLLQYIPQCGSMYLYIYASWTIYKSFLSQGWWYLWGANGDAGFSVSIFIKVSARSLHFLKALFLPGLNHGETLDVSASCVISQFRGKTISVSPS